MYHHFEDYGITAEFHFTATAHGKYECDGACGVCKRTARIHSLKGNLIQTPKELYDFLRRKLSSQTLDFLYVNSDEVEYCLQTLQTRYEHAKKIVGNRKFHSVQVHGQDLRCRYFSKDDEFIDVNYVLPEKQRPRTRMVNEFAAIRSNGQFCVGMVTATRVTADDSEIQLQLMKQHGKSNSLKWPEPPNLRWFSLRELIATVESPTTATGRIYKFTQGVFTQMETAV